MRLRLFFRLDWENFVILITFIKSNQIIAKISKLELGYSCSCMKALIYTIEYGEFVVSTCEIATNHLIFLLPNIYFMNDIRLERVVYF